MKPGDIIIERVRDEQGLAALSDTWDELLCSVPRMPIFLTWEWVSTWWRHWGGGSELWLLAARDRVGRLLGVAPWMLTRQRMGGLLHVRRVSFIGHGLVYPAHLDIIAEPELESVLSQHFAAYLMEHCAAWDVLDLEDLSPASTLRGGWPAGAGRFAHKEGKSGLFVALPESWSAYEMGQLSARRRKSLRQSMRLLEQDHPGAVKFRRLNSRTAVRDGMEALVRMSRERWNGKGLPSAFDDDAFVAFHQDIAAAALDRGWLRFTMLTAGDEILAADYSFRYGQVQYGYQAAFAAEWEKYSPGQLLTAHVIGQAIAEGVRQLDFMRGKQGYKYSWASDEQADYHVLISRSYAGDLWLYGSHAYDRLRATAKKVLPPTVQDRINHVLSTRSHA